ncbi:MAG: Hpt domain-containing protein [Clostridia bacterium]|nr:Hpt domain-containing protein [Clostridia bacterium]
MKELFVKLKQAECDVEGALARFLDDEDLYEQFYGELLKDPAFENLGEAIEQGKTYEAFEYAHTLKGIIGNMGLTPLFETVCDIVEPLRINSLDGVKEKYAELISQRDKFKEF